MKFFLTLIFLSVTFFTSWAQNLKLSEVATQKGNWLQFNKKVKATQFFNDYALDLGLDENPNMKLLQSKVDDLGFEHLKYQQTYKGIPIEGAEYILHVRNQFVEKSNGLIEKNFSKLHTPNITAEQALVNAKKHLPAEQYSWENAAAEKMIKDVKKDPKATYLPQPQLVFTKLVGNTYRLVYKFEINAVSPIIRKDVYVDALSGNVILSINKLHHADEEGTAKTKYSGTRKIMTSKTSPSVFKLKESGRCGIETYNMKKLKEYEKAVDFTDDNNVWENVNANRDEVATDAHWGSEQTYDYYLQTHNRRSFDDKNSKLINYVHYDKNYANAFWNGTVMTYGDGDTVRIGALVSLDIIAHEITHGVTENSAALIYLNESGALNESFSDIFGVSVDFFAKGSSANFEIGEEISLVGGGGFRSMANPKAKKDPATYQGMYWEFSSADNGGVHTNSGVQNYWYYLLCEGGSGTNDKGNAYNVTGLGMAKAAKIAYRNLTTYLTSTSNYADAREGSLQAAADIYGECSAEYKTVATAWFAVGVGYPLQNNDLWFMSLAPNLKTSCNLSKSEKITITLKYNSCDGNLPVGTKIPVSYFINGNESIDEVMTLTQEIHPSQTFDYTFVKRADLSAAGKYVISAQVNYPSDPESRNNFSAELEVKKPKTFNNMYFEDYFVSEDSFYTNIGSDAQLLIDEKAKKSGTLGLLITGSTPSPNLDFPDGKNNFEVNESNKGDISFCIDASKSEDKITLTYDYRQSYTSFYEIMAQLFPELGGLDFKNASSLRLAVNGVQVGGVMRPATYTRDVFKKVTVDLSKFKGQQFELSFQGRCLSSEAGIKAVLRQLNLPIPVEGADEIWLDNIEISGLVKKDEIPTAIINDALENAVSLFPNPTKNTAFLTYKSEKTETVTVSVQDLLGRNLLDLKKDINLGENKIELNVGKKGMFLVSLQTEKGTVVRRLIVE